MKLTEKFHLVYKTTTTPFFPICLVGKSFSERFKELIGEEAEPKDIIVLISDGAVNWFFDKSLKSSAEKLFSNYYAGYSEAIKIKEKEVSKKLFDEIKTPIKELFFNKKLNKKGEEKLQEIFRHYSSYALFVDVPGFLFQLYLSDALKNEIFVKLDKSDEEKNEIFNFIISSYKKTNYERFLFAISENMGNKKGLKQAADDFYWVVHDYLGDIIDLRYIENKIKEFEKNKDLNKYLEGAVYRIEKIEQIKKELPQDLLNKVNIIQEVLYLYNERKKEVLNQVNVYLRKIMEYKFKGYSVSEIRKLYQLTPDEILDLLKGKKIKDILKRDKHWAYSIRDGVISSASEKYFEIFSPYKDVKILRGIPASSGTVKGRINIILNISHIYKFRRGDILVAPFTNVNYLPIMGKSKAILTETGGVTSHAAVVSRELKVPCIVGIKNLLLALKDGDYVEVDANEGVIKIIK